MYLCEVEKLVGLVEGCLSTLAVQMTEERRKIFLWVELDKKWKENECGEEEDEGEDNGFDLASLSKDMYFEGINQMVEESEAEVVVAAEAILKALIRWWW